jgi:hypothetical protein
MTDLMRDMENAIAGCFLALLTAMDRDAADRAVETLFAFVADSGTPEYERKFYADLAESIAELTAPPAPRGLLEDLFATVH